MKSQHLARGGIKRYAFPHFFNSRKFCECRRPTDSTLIMLCSIAIQFGLNFLMKHAIYFRVICQAAVQPLPYRQDEARLSCTAGLSLQLIVLEKRIRFSICIVLFTMNICECPYMWYPKVNILLNTYHATCMMQDLHCKSALSPKIFQKHENSCPDT